MSQKDPVPMGLSQKMSQKEPVPMEHFVKRTVPNQKNYSNIALILLTPEELASSFLILKWPNSLVLDT